ncbi:MAG: hypothetical protein J6R22_02740 [Alphaproteobacteria bacterium]|nr:hypothetical protein [Alphaproteobacteria bacterium]
MNRSCRIFSNNNRGASVLEVLLSMAIIAVVAPFIYTQIARTNHTIYDVAVARKITEIRDNVLNYVRSNHSQWPDNAQIRLDGQDLSGMSEAAIAGFIDKYENRGATVTDVYLAFDLGVGELRTNQIASHIGADAAVVGADGIAYGNTWAVMAPDFSAGNLIYRISRDVVGEDTSKYLHRGTTGEDNLNVMERDFNMAGYNVFDVAAISAQSAEISNVAATFVSSQDVSAESVYFSSGANIEGQGIRFGSLRVTGDTNGFRNISAANVNGRGYTTNGRIITDRAKITGSVNVANDLILKSSTTRSINSFTGITANSVVAPYISATEMMFYNNFGLTVSGELLVSTTAPIKIGTWTFPSTRLPQFTAFNLTRSSRPVAPNIKDFAPLTSRGWKTVSASAIK